MGTHNDGKALSILGFGPDAPYWAKKAQREHAQAIEKQLAHLERSIEDTK